MMSRRQAINDTIITAQWAGGATPIARRTTRFTGLAGIARINNKTIIVARRKYKLGFCPVHIK